MYKLLYLTFLFTLLHAQSPKPFSTLGNPIYQNLEKIIILKNMNIYQAYTEDINKYIKDVKKIKTMGFALEATNSKVTTKKYLEKLRQLSKKNEYFLESINNYYTTALAKSDTVLFNKIINSGLIDVKKHQKEIYSYYKEHVDKMSITPLLEKIIDEEEKKRVKKAKQKKYKSQHTRAEDKIRRMHRNDKKVRIALEKKLQEELDKKKKAIRERQCRELQD